MTDSDLEHELNDNDITWKDCFYRRNGYNIRGILDE